MSEEPEPIDEPEELETIDDTEVVQAEVVDASVVGVELTAAPDLRPARPIDRPAVQAAAAAATGFLAGAATLALLRRGDARRLARRALELESSANALAAARTGLTPGPGQTYLVHVRVLTPPPRGNGAPGAAGPPRPHRPR